MLQLDAAMKRYEQAIKSESASIPEAINNLGTMYYAEKRYRRATAILQARAEAGARLGFDLQQPGHRLLRAQEI